MKIKNLCNFKILQHLEGFPLREREREREREDQNIGGVTHFLIWVQDL